ncbi:hypothetical protein TWF106_011540 [Orbilia oligospora]|uniref:NB-ARC domain-containing protein n=1 Tax=Orbilia oligospora TaxID=2813651 RepID=A0A7C8UEM4_ORBOL|nr:hypothetical protein TWF106_011540 [Orbilia oligospora]
MATKLQRSRNDYTVGWICAIPIEIEVARKILDGIHPKLKVPADDENCYEFGEINGHNVVISWLPRTKYGTTNAALVANCMRKTFKRLRFGLMIGVGGGAPSPFNDIRLGDIVVSQPTDRSGGVIQYDFGKAMEKGEFKMIGSLNAPPRILLSGVAAMAAIDPIKLGRRIFDVAWDIEKEDEERGGRFSYPGEDTDKLFRGNYLHVPGEGRWMDTCNACACDTSTIVTRSKRQSSHPQIHYGVIASGNQVMKDGVKRDQISTETGALCFEMEAAGLMDNFPCLVVRGICDYSDGHKNKRWQPYAALVAAVYAKELLSQIPAACEDETEIHLGRRIIDEVNFALPLRMPFPRNHTFVGRKEKLTEIHEYFTRTQFSNAPRIFALVGTGGMGKTQIAIEYAYRHHGSYYTAVLWVSAANEETIRTSFIDIMEHIIEEQARITWPESTPDYEMISRKLGIAGLVNSRGEIIVDSEIIINDIQKALFHWLQLSKNSKWLLIIDNADDLENFDIQKYIPNHGSGDIFVTSRRPEFSHVAEQANLEQLDKDSAINLLSSLAHITVPRKDVEHELVAVVTKLGFMPLAISHAGHFMQQTKVSPGEYLLHYEEAFMDAQARIPRFGWNYRRDKASTTWEMSFSRVEKENTEAAFLLLMCSYLNYEEISEDLWDTERFNRVEFREMVGLLSSYSLVMVVGTGIFSVHPVVHSWARERLAQSERFAVLKDVLILLGNASGRDKMSRDGNNWDPREERMILAHLRYLDQHFDPSASESFFHQEETKTGVETTAENKNLAIALYNIAVVYKNGGKYDKAIQWYEQVLPRYEKAFGKDHISTLQVIADIAAVYHSQGDYDTALHYYKQAFFSCRKIFGKNHISTLSAMGNISSLYIDQHKYNKAGKYYQRVLAGCRRHNLSENNPLIFRAVGGVATVYGKLGEYDEALRWYERAIASSEKFFGKDHPSTLRTVSTLASIYYDQKEYSVAMQLYKQVLDGRERVLGEDHPLTLETIDSLASVYQNQGSYDVAIQLYEKALTGREKCWGENHTFTFETFYNLASVYHNQGSYDVAIQLFERVLTGGEKCWGEDHPMTIETINSLALAYQYQGSYDVAIQLFQKALPGRKKCWGEDHPLTIETVNSLASIYQNQGSYDVAIQLYEQVLIDGEKCLGEDHPLTLAAICNISSIYTQQNRYDEAIQWTRRAFTSYEKFFGTHHPETVDLTNNIASLYCRQGKFKKALLWCKRALVGKGKALGGSKLSSQDYLQMFDLVHTIASIHRGLGQCNEAIKWYKRALIGKAKALANGTASGKDCQPTLDGVHHILEQIASIYKHHGKYDKAIQWYKRELFSRRRIFGRIHPSAVNAIRDIASLYKKKGMRNKAMRWYKRYKRLATVEGGGGFGRTLPSNVVEISVNRPKKRTKSSP